MKIKKYLFTIFGIFICAVSFNIFFSPYKIVPSGTSGLGIIFNSLFGLKEEITIIMFSMMFLIIGYIFLDKNDVKKTILGSFLFPLFISLFRIIFVKVDLSIDNAFLTSIVGGVTFGFGLGLIYRQDHFIGGFDILNRILDKFLNINYSIITLCTDLLVIIIGGLTLGFSTFIYSAVAIFIARLMIDKVSIGIGDSRSFYIITTKADSIKKLITEDLGHGATILKGHGAYSKEDKYIIYVVIPKKDYFKLRDGIKKIDKHAFFVVSSSYEVGGGKWLSI